MGFLKVRKPKAIMFDMCATMTKSHFMDQVLFPYFKEAAKAFLETYWKNDVVMEDVKRLRAQSKTDEGPAIVGEDENEEAIRGSVVKYIDACMNGMPKRESDALSVFRFHVLFEGYSRNRLITPVYSDVAFQVRHWVADLKIKLYIFSNCWTEASKRFLSHTNHGNMNLLIEDHFDNTMGSLDQKETHQKVAKKLNQPPEDILFLTHNVKEAIAARKAGLSTILVVTHRRDLKLISDDEKNVPSIRSFNELAFTSDAVPASQLPPGSTADDDGGSSSSVPATSSNTSPASKTKLNSKVSATSSASNASNAKKSSAASKDSNTSSATQNVGASTATPKKDSKKVVALKTPKKSSNSSKKNKANK